MPSFVAEHDETTMNTSLLWGGLPEFSSETPAYSTTQLEAPQGGFMAMLNDNSPLDNFIFNMDYLT